MSAILYLKKKIGQSYLVWFQNSNNYLQLEEPAWFVLRKTAQRHKTETIAHEFAYRYSVSQKKSLAFVEGIRLEIKRMNLPDPSSTSQSNFYSIPGGYTFSPYSVRFYQIGIKLIKLVFETPHLENYIHPLIGHLETNAPNAETALFELFVRDEKIVFRYNGEIKGAWKKDESHLVKGLIFMFLINVMYEKTKEDWLMTVHASAISNGRKTILFSAPPNHGKTTFAALLQNCGFQLISDDFVPIEKHSFCAYPFPIAMSVKQSSTELLTPIFPALKQKTLNYISPEKSVRFLPPEVNPDFTKNVFPVKEFVFIKYDKNVDLAWEKLDPLKGLKLLLDQAWVSPGKNNAEIFLEQLPLRSFYQLTYSDNEKALETITHLFENDK